MIYQSEKQIFTTKDGIEFEGAYLPTSRYGTKKYFFDVYADGEYIWRDAVEWLPAQIKSKAKECLNRERFKFANDSLKIIVREFETENIVFEYERPVSPESV